MRKSSFWLVQFSANRSSKQVDLLHCNALFGAVQNRNRLSGADPD
jgi:hypothetical protein